MKKIIGLVSLVVLSLSTISCSKDEDPFDYSCVDLDAAELYKSGFPEDYDDVVGQNMYYYPVCGCNGKSYPNDHFAMLEGIFTFTKGACK